MIGLFRGDAMTGSRRGAVTLLLALMLPVLMWFGMLAADSANFHYRNILLRQTVEAAALAAGNHLAEYYTTGSDKTVIAAAQNFAGANDPTGHYGVVVPAPNVVLGNWNASTSKFTSLHESDGTAPNSVQVTGVNTIANGNPVGLFFGGIMGMPTRDLTVAVVATSASGQPFNTIMVNDLSVLFSAMMSQQQALDIAALDCVTASAHPISQFGVMSFTAHGQAHQSLMPATANYDALVAKIKKLAPCGSAGAPACGGANIAAGIYAAIQQFSDPKLAATPKNVVIVTDGLPVAVPFLVYSAQDGNTQYSGGGNNQGQNAGTPVCPMLCTDVDLLTMAQAQASEARAQGISVSTIYYAGNTPAAARAYVAASLATLRKGKGLSLIANTPAQIASSFAGVCASVPASLASVH